MSPPASWQPWDRQSGESDRAYALFQQFLALDQPRDMSALVRRGGHTLAELDALRFDWFWCDRARHWDEHLDAIRRQTIEDVTKQTAEDVARRQLRLTMNMQELASLEVDKLLDISRRSDAPGLVNVRELVRLAGVGLRLERVIRGEVTDRVETKGNLGDLSAEDLRELRKLQQKAGVR